MALISAPTFHLEDSRFFSSEKFKAAARKESRKHQFSFAFPPAPPRTTPSRISNHYDTYCVNPAEDSSFSRHRDSTPIATSKVRFTVGSQVRGVLFNSWLMLLFPCVPAGIALHFTLGDSVPTFIVNFVALIPLGFLSQLGLDEISFRVGGFFMGFLYICTSNFVQLVGSIVLLRSRQTELLQTSLIGGLLANLLLILGLSILSGGIGRQVQYFNLSVAQTSANLLSLAATSLLIPTASKLLGQIEPQDIPKQSRGSAFILLSLYACYLIYQFKSHVEIFKEESQKVERQPFRKLPPGIDAAIQAGTAVGAGAVALKNVEGEHALANLRRLENADDDEEIEERQATLSASVAWFTFLAASTLLALCVDYTVNSIQALSTGANLSHTFIGLILLPIPNCDFSPIANAIEDQLDNTMTYTIGKCLQTALFITPLTVLIAWGMGVDEMTMVFDGFEIVSLFAAILLLNFLMEKGCVTWIQGCLLLGDWALVAISAFFAKQATSG